MTDAKSGCAAGEASVGDKGALLSKMATLDVGRGIEHLLHSRTSLWTFVSDDHTVATLHLSSEDALAGCFLRIEDGLRHHGR